MQFSRPALAASERPLASSTNLEGALAAQPQERTPSNTGAVWDPAAERRSPLSGSFTIGRRVCIPSPDPGFAREDAHSALEDSALLVTWPWRRFDFSAVERRSVSRRSGSFPYWARLRRPHASTGEHLLFSNKLSFPTLRQDLLCALQEARVLRFA